MGRITSTLERARQHIPPKLCDVTPRKVTTLADVKVCPYVESLCRMMNFEIFAVRWHFFLAAVNLFQFVQALFSAEELFYF